MRKLLEASIEEDWDDLDDGLDDFVPIDELSEEDKIRHYIQRFFKDREMHCGGSISEKSLLNYKNIELVMNTSMADAWDKAYAALENAAINATGAQDRNMVLKICDICCWQFAIPKQNAGGILLLYLQFCEGVEI